MAKLRVYELARELNMTNKELLDKLQELEIEVKSHMSSLEETTVTDIRNALFGKTEQTKVEDTRIKPNIIRRRRKRVAEAQAADEAAQDDEIVAERAEPPEAETEPAETETTAPPEETAQPAEEVPETEPAEVAAPVQEAETPAEAPSAEVEAEAPAEPVETTPAEPVEVEVEPVEAKAEEPETPEVAPAETAGEAEAAAGPETTREPVEPEVSANAEAVADQAAARTETELESKKAEEPEAKPKKAKKKQKKSTPAKIISLPEEIEEPAPEPKREAPAARKPAGPGRKPPVAEPVIEAKAEAVDDRKKSRKKRAVVEPETDEEKGKRGKKKASFKRKEVVEGAALVDQRFGRGRKGGKKKGKAARATAAEHQTQITIPKAIKRRIKVDESIILADLAKRMGVKANELIKQLMGMGIMVTVNQAVDFDTATLLAGEFNFEVERASFEEETILRTEEDEPENLQFRPPVVTIMGHVDHGKTSLLDVIRHARVAEDEAGGITQHIGAYHVPHETGSIVFLDTPGHEAFTAMRARGAQVTDIVVLVVAADDGVMPQTIEAIDHSRAAGVPIIVAVNKIDKPEADLERIKRELAEKGLVPEDWGGDTIFVNVSAKKKIGIDELLEMIILQSEVLELKANPNKLARGYIIESRLETGRGPVASVLISEGTLKTGESVVSGMYYGKIRAMFNDRGEPVKEAGPSMPVEIIGLTGVPMAGDELITLTDEKDAKQVSEHRLQKQRSMELAKTTRMSLDSLYEQMLEGEVKDLNLIIKADVQGSIEALKDSLTKLSTNEVKINVMHSATGTIHESDVSLAAVSNAIILGFNVRPTGKVTQMAEEENVDIRYYNVIYNAIKEIKDAMLGMMASRFEERVLGRAEVREIFTVPHVGTIAGCMVIDGKIQRGQPIRLVRDGIVIHEGKIASLRRYKDDVKEVAQNYECGIGIEKYNDIKLNDIIECYYLEEIKPVME